MKNIFKGVLIYSLALLTLTIMVLISDMNKPTPQASISSCEFCEGACKLCHRTACETNYNTPNYYYLTYKCEVCGNEFTIEIIQEQKS